MKRKLGKGSEISIYNTCYLYQYTTPITYTNIQRLYRTYTDIQHLLLIPIYNTYYLYQYTTPSPDLYRYTTPITYTDLQHLYRAYADI